MEWRQTRERLGRIWRFVADDVWDVELTSLPAMRSFGIKALRVVNLVFRGFRDDDCPLHASALTFSTLMSIVPILAFSLALARGLGDEQSARNRIRQAISDWTSTFEQPVVAASDALAPAPPEREAGDLQLADQINRMVEQAFERVENINFAALGGIGLALLLWMVIQVLGRVEGSFNNVWGVAVGRSVWRKFTDYLSVLVVLPILVVAATSIPVVQYATRFLDESTAALVRSFLVSGFLRGLTVLVMTTLTFAFVILFMPNTKVKPLPALAGGIIAAVLFLGWLRICAALQVGVARAGAIYGSFATVPILLAWVYVSWQIVLFGAEVAFAVQNCATYRMERGARLANMQARVTLALTVLAEAARAMLGRAPQFELSVFARERGIPVRFLNDVVDELVQAGLLAAIAERPGVFTMLRSPPSLEVREVIDVFNRSGVGSSELGLSTIEPPIADAISRAAGGLERSLEGVTIQSLVEGAAGPATEGPDGAR